ncbi:MAG: glycosyltransferase [Nitrospirae bacterium]|nr:MAG: glycosyltransferase [Nitrospirota bacterium]
MKRAALGVFFRTPEMGRCKSRLAVALGEEKAFDVYKAMLSATFNNLGNLRGIDVFGFYDGLKPFGLPPNPIIEFFPQQGETLGERMHKALKLMLGFKYYKAALIGSDIPDLPVQYIHDAFDHLDLNDLVLGPAEDGGYYLIGMKRPLGFLFDDMEWGDDRVLGETIKRAEKHNISYALLPQWHDIDDLEGLGQWKPD